MLKTTGEYVVFFLNKDDIEFLEEEEEILLFPTRESAETYCTQHDLQNWHVGSLVERE